MSRPTPAQLQRVLDVVAAGLDLDDAIESVWADEPTPKQTKPTVMVTEFPDGVVIGWDHCTVLNGGCGRPVGACNCKGGPKELKIFSKWREAPGTMPAYATTKTPTPVPSIQSSPRTGVRAAPTGQVVCVGHRDFVDQSEADKNDDGTWTCYSCQEAGFQRGVTA